MLRRTVTSFALVASLSMAVGCASSGGATRGDSRMLTSDELATVEASNVYEAIERLRPRWLEIRSVHSLSSGVGQIVVFLNRSYLGDPDVLRQFQPHQVVRIRYLDGPQASTSLSGYDTSRHVVAGIVLEIAER